MKHGERKGFLPNDVGWRLVDIEKQRRRLQILQARRHVSAMQPVLGPDWPTATASSIGSNQRGGEDPNPDPRSVAWVG